MNFTGTTAVVTGAGRGLGLSYAHALATLGANVVISDIGADKLGAGYAELSDLNPGLIYCSVTGYGQSGPMAQRAGHDINYLAIGGALGTFGPAGSPPVPPLNLVADFAGGGLLSAFGIVSALYDKIRTGKGRYIDSAMVDGVLSMMGMNFVDWQTPTLPEAWA